LDRWKVWETARWIWSDVTKSLQSSLGDGTVGILFPKPVGMGGRYPQRGGGPGGGSRP